MKVFFPFYFLGGITIKLNSVQCRANRQQQLLIRIKIK